MDTENFDSFSDDSVFGFDLNEEQYKPLHDFNDNSIGAMVLETASLNLILSTIEKKIYHNKSKSVNSVQLVEFIWTSVLDSISYRIHCLQTHIDKELNHELTRSKYNMYTQFYNIIKKQKMEKERKEKNNKKW